MRLSASPQLLASQKRCGTNGLHCGEQVDELRLLRRGNHRDVGAGVVVVRAAFAGRKAGGGAHIAVRHGRGVIDQPWHREIVVRDLDEVVFRIELGGRAERPYIPDSVFGA